ncbi:hypothetical protein K438DRAFT_1890574, partial [Mycena galopus ATCC 62051]
MGNSLQAVRASSETEPDPSLTAAQFWAKYGGKYIQKDLVLDGALFHHLHRTGIPPGTAKLTFCSSTTGSALSVRWSGSIGMHVFSSGDDSLSPNGADDMVQPMVDWWLFVKDEKDMEQRSRNAYQQNRGKRPY